MDAATEGALKNQLNAEIAAKEAVLGPLRRKHYLEQEEAALPFDERIATLRAQLREADNKDMWMILGYGLTKSKESTVIGVYHTLKDAEANAPPNSKTSTYEFHRVQVNPKPREPMVPLGLPF
jgi:hypothetical protein